MKSLPDIFAAVAKENIRSMEKYGSWKRLPDCKQRLVMEGEFEEWQNAYYLRDTHGLHGEVAELIQVMNCCARRILYLEGSPDA